MRVGQQVLRRALRGLSSISCHTRANIAESERASEWAARLKGSARGDRPRSKGRGHQFIAATHGCQSASGAALVFSSLSEESNRPVRSTGQNSHRQEWTGKGQKWILSGINDSYALIFTFTRE